MTQWRRRSTRKRRHFTLRLALTGTLAVAAVGLGAQPAAADGGQSSEEGYVMVLQALSFLLNDPGASGTEQALAMVDDALAAEDQDGVAVDQLQEGRAALQAGQTEAARELLQGSIDEAIAGLEPAVGEETGTTVMLGPLPPREALSGTDWLFLALSVLVALAGAVLSFLFRPAESLRELRRDVLAAQQAGPDPSVRSSRGSSS